MDYTFIYYFDRPTRVWFAFWADVDGNQIGPSQHGPTKEQALVNLGLAGSPAALIERGEA